MSSAAQSADVRHLREWIDKQPHLPRVEDDAFLERFLLGCKGSLPRCKEVLDMYYTVRAAVPELFKNRDPTSQEIRGIAKTAYSVTLQQLTPVGYHVTLLGLLDTNPSRFSYISFMRRLFMQMDMFLAATMCTGAVIVTDLAGASFGHMGGLTPSLLKKFLLCAQDAWPGRIREFHIMNGPPLTGTIIEVAKRYVKEKTIVKIHVHKGPETLYEFIPREMLPAEYGGEAGSISDLNGISRKGELWECLLDPLKKLLIKMEEHLDWRQENANSIQQGKTSLSGQIMDADIFTMGRVNMDEDLAEQSEFVNAVVCPACQFSICRALRDRRMIISDTEAVILQELKQHE